MELYSVATGNVDPLNTASREAVKFIKSLSGLIGVHPGSNRGTLWMFDSIDHARSAKNRMDEAGITTGTNICKFKMCKDGSAEFQSVCERIV